ncbi:MAG: hypothetical protein N2167_11175 [Flavobacteriales bacterium]|nr:hypothetical protein [Flavobacteriales bacterium]
MKKYIQFIIVITIFLNPVLGQFVPNYQNNYWEDPYIPVEKSMKTASELPSYGLQQVEQLDVYPLPATQWVSFSYQMLPSRTDITLEIIHPMGYVIYHTPLHLSSGVHVVETTGWKPGMYHYQIRAKGDRVFTGNLIIQ